MSFRYSEREGKYRRKYENSLGTELDQVKESFCILSEYFRRSSIPSLTITQDQNLEMKFFFSSSWYDGWYPYFTIRNVVGVGEWIKDIYFYNEN